MRYDPRTIVELAKSGMAQVDIARTVGGSRQRIHQILTKLRAPKPKPKWEEAFLSTAQLASVDGLPQRKAAAVLGVSKDTIAKYRQRYGVKPAPPPRGFGSRGHKLAALVKMKWVRLPRLRRGQRVALAKSLGVSPAALTAALWQAGRRVNAK